jgi:endonuclease/exonuclease/phosphatase family metal-dependent hydrolase
MAIALDVMWGDTPVRIVNAHLENQCLAKYRMAQVDAMLKADREELTRGPSVIVGDMNTFFLAEPKLLLKLASELGFADVMPTTRPRGTWGRIFKLDWILARNLVAVGSGVSRDVRSSDHKPIWATFAKMRS